MSAYALPMSIQKLFALFVALAVLIAPSVTYAAMPMAMGSHNGMQMMEMGHCEAPPSKTDGKAPVKTCCISMCMAVAIAPLTPTATVQPSHATTYFAALPSWHGYLGEIATPPPRTA